MSVKYFFARLRKIRELFAHSAVPTRHAGDRTRSWNELQLTQYIQCPSLGSARRGAPLRGGPENRPKTEFDIGLGGRPR